MTSRDEIWATMNECANATLGGESTVEAGLEKLGRRRSQRLSGTWGLWLPTYNVKRCRVETIGRHAARSDRSRSRGALHKSTGHVNEARSMERVVDHQAFVLGLKPTAFNHVRTTRMALATSMALQNVCRPVQLLLTITPPKRIADWHARNRISADTVRRRNAGFLTHSAAQVIRACSSTYNSWISCDSHDRRYLQADKRHREMTPGRTNRILAL